MMLKADHRSQDEAQTKGQGSLPANASFYLLPLDQQTGIAPTFPFTANDSGSGATVTGGQIARANRPGEVGRFRQVTALFTIGAKHAVAPRCGCTPGAVASPSSDQGQSIFGVDANYFTPGHSDLGEYVDQANAALTNFNSRVIEQNPGCHQNSEQGWQGRERQQKTAASKNYSASRDQQPSYDKGQNSTKTRVKNYGLHATKFASDIECEVLA
jgi:hypothetical protein